jgi:hypothetical protein
MLTGALMPPPVTEYAHASAGTGDTGKPLGSALILMTQSNPTVCCVRVQDTAMTSE